MSKIIIIFTLLLTAIPSYSKCQLMPKVVDFNSMKFINAHDKMVESFLNQSFKTEYKKLKNIYASTRKVNQKMASLKRRLKKTHSLSKNETYRLKNELKGKIKKFKQSKNILKESALSLYDPLILQFHAPQFSYLENGKIIGDFTVEGFIRPRPNKQFYLPLLGLQFLISEQTIVYYCANFDKIDKNNNYISVRFLKHNRPKLKNLDDYLKNPYSMFTHLRSYLTPPRVRIESTNLNTTFVKSTINPIADIFSHFGPLVFLKKILSHLTVSIDRAIGEIIMDIVGIGVKSLSIDNKTLKMQFALSTGIQIIKFDNIYQYKKKDDYSFILNHFTLEE